MNMKTQVTMDDIRGAVGSHFLVWSRVEREMKQALSEIANVKPPHTISQVLDAWYAEVTNSQADEVKEVIDRALEMRNRLAHGVVAYGVPGIHTELNGEEKHFTYHDLTTTNQILVDTSMRLKGLMRG
ncbi:hypothetical protein [Ruegeria arenilitoris]|uniref:hypothetical protein n=1 Tax=Ruegeria arenilitoris TaxID=1173585 RepID=UPI00147AE2AB|nr:hypothetical protein [Ruegeria arenilitoris]